MAAGLASSRLRLRRLRAASLEAGTRESASACVNSVSAIAGAKTRGFAGAD